MSQLGQRSCPPAICTLPPRTRPGNCPPPLERAGDLRGLQQPHLRAGKGVRCCTQGGTCFGFNTDTTWFSRFFWRQKAPSLGLNEIKLPTGGATSQGDTTMVSTRPLHRPLSSPGQRSGHCPLLGGGVLSLCGQRAAFPGSLFPRGPPAAQLYGGGRTSSHCAPPLGPACVVSQPLGPAVPSSRGRRSLCT